MARPPRIEFQGAFYHVFQRGNRKQDIFHDDRDRQQYLNLISRYKEKHDFSVHAYALMNNHVHLLIETGEVPLSRLMQGINVSYAQFFNLRHGTVGHLFQGRYGATLCDRDEYLLELVAYIHLNPVRAGVVEDPERFDWSGHRTYLGHARGPADTDSVLRLFSENLTESRRLYAEHINSKLDAARDEISDVPRSKNNVMGGEDFFRDLKEQASTALHFSRPPEPDRVIETFCRVFETDLVIISSRRRDRELMETRGELARIWRKSGLPLASLARIVERDVSVVSRWENYAPKSDRGKGFQQVIDELHAHMQA